eukprot:6127535-Pyramimonas_sp.AAC.1
MAGRSAPAQHKAPTGAHQAKPGDPPREPMPFLHEGKLVPPGAGASYQDPGVFLDREPALTHMAGDDVW